MTQQRSHEHRATPQNGYNCLATLIAQLTDALRKEVRGERSAAPASIRVRDWIDPQRG